MNDFATCQIRAGSRIDLIKDVVLLGAAIWSLGKALIPKEKPTIEP